MEVTDQNLEVKAQEDQAIELMSKDPVGTSKWAEIETTITETMTEETREVVLAKISIVTMSEITTNPKMIKIRDKINDRFEY